MKLTFTPFLETKKSRVLFALSALVFVECFLILFVDRPLASYFHSFGYEHPLTIFSRTITDAGLDFWYSWVTGVASAICGATLIWDKIDEKWKKPFVACSDFSFSRFVLLLASVTILLLWPSWIVFLICLTLGSWIALWTERRDWMRENLRLVFSYVFFFFVSIEGSSIVCNFIKGVVGRARPKLLFQENVFDFEPMTFGAHAWNSFPSGHTTTIFAVATALGILFPKTRFWAYGFAVLVGLSRIVLTAHYASDVVAGAVLGTSVVIGINFLFRMWRGTSLPARNF